MKMFLYEITHTYLKNDYQFFDSLKKKHRKIRGSCNLLIKVKFHKFSFKDQELCILNERKTTCYFKVERGTRQGNPI